MPKNNNIDFNLNVKKGDTSGLESLKRDLAQIRTQVSNPDWALVPLELKQVLSTVNALDRALDKAFDVNLNTINIQKFNQLLAQSGLNAKSIQQNLTLAGSAGNQAFLKLTAQLMQFNTATKQTNQFLNNIAASFFNTVKYTAFNAILNNIASTVSRANNYVKDLDTSLNDIRIVTGKSADEMERFAEDANNAAKELAVTTKEYTKGSLIYYQQGLDDETVQTLTDITAMTSNVTGQSMEVISEQLTAVWNGYQVANEAAREGMQVYQEYVDKMAAVGATTASDLQELSSAMSKVASAASAMGVTFDDLNAQIATIVSVTRQAPESVGTALKTIYARLGDLKVDGVDEFGTKLGEVSEQLQTMGIRILDTNGDMRDMSSVMTEVAGKWDTWTSAQKQAAAVAMAGKRQYNNLVALFDNWDMYGDALATSMNAAGTLEKQQEIALDSLANKMDQLAATAEDLYDSLIDENNIKKLIEGLTKVVQLLVDFADAVGGINNLIPMVGATAMRVFNQQIAEGLSTIIINARTAKSETEMMEQNYAALHSMFKDSNIFNPVQGDNATALAQKQSLQELMNYYQQIQQYQGLMNQAEKEQHQNILDMKREAGELNIQIAEQKEHWLATLKCLQVINKDSMLNLAEKTDKVADGVRQIKSAADGLESLLKTNLFGQHDVLNSKDFKQLLIDQDIGESTSQVNGLVKRFNQLNGSSTAVRQVIAQIVQDLRKVGDGANDLINLQTRMDNLNSSAQSLANNLENNLNIKQLVANFVNLAGAVGQLGIGLNTLTNIFNILDNDSISSSDKLLQVVMNLTFALPALTSSFNTARASLNSFIAGMSAATLATQAETAAELASQSARALNNQLLVKQNANIVKNMTAKQMDLVVQRQSNAGMVAATLAGKAYNKMSAAQRLALKQEIIAQATKTAALNAATRAQLIANVATAAAIALAAIVLLAVKAQQKQIEKTIENSKATLESVKAKQEEIKANNELYESYQKLYKQYKNGDDVQKDLYDSAIKLADAYGILDGRLLAISGNYEEINRQAKELQKTQLEEQRDLANRGARAASEKAVAQMRSGRGHLSGDQYVFDVSTIESMGEAARMRAATAMVGLSDNVVNDSTFQLSIDYTNPKEVKKWMDQVDDMVKYYETAYDDLTLKDDAFYKQLKEEQKDMAESAQELTEQLALQYQAETELAFRNVAESNKINLDETISTSGLADFREKVRASLEGIIPSEEIDKYINDYLNGLDEINEQVTRLKIADKIQEEFGDGTEEGLQEAIKKINNFNDEQLAYLDVHFNNNMLDEDLQNWMNEHQDIIEALGVKGASTRLKSTLSTYKEGEKYSKEETESLYSSQYVAPFLSPGQAEFSVMDSSSQLQAVTLAWIDSTKAIAENKEAIEAHITALIKDLDEEALTKDYLGQEQEAYAGIDEVIGENTEYKNKAVTVAKALATGTGELTVEQQAYLDALFNLEGQEIKDKNVLKEKLTEYGKAINVADNYKSSVSVLTSELEQVTNSSWTYKEASKKLTEVIEQENSAIDTIQKTYGNLLDIIEAYNKTGHWTVDNVQKLMELSDEYVASLDLQNGTLSLNEQYIQAVTIAKLEEMKQTALAHYQTELDNIALMTNAEAAAAAAAGALAAGTAFGTMGEQAKQATQDLLAMADAYREAANLSSSDQVLLEERARKALENRLQAIDDAITEVSKGGASMKRALKTGKSSGKDKDKDKKEYRDEFDRYFELKKAIDSVDRAIKKLDKDQENLYGKELIRSLKQENELLADQTQLYEQLAAAQREEAGELQGLLKGYGLTFDASGAINNYVEATTAALKQYNDAVTNYNAGLLDESAFKVYEKNYEKFKKVLSRYDTLFYTEMKDTQEKLDELWRKELANNLKAWEVEIQLKLDWKQLERDWNDFLTEISKDFKSVFKDLRVELKSMLTDAGTYGGSGGTINSIIGAVHDVTGEIDKLMGGGSSSMFESVSQAQEKLKELNTQLMDSSKELYSLWEKAWDNYLDGIDQVSDAFDKLLARFERINDELEFQSKLIELLYGDEAYGLMSKLYEGQERNAEVQLQSLKTQVDMWKQLFDASGATMENQMQWSEDQQKYYDNWVEAQTALNDLVLEYIELLKRDYINTVSDVLKQLESFVTGGSSLSYMATQWERISDNAAKYYDDVEGAYYIQTLANKINEGIANSSSLKAQQKLIALREKEITYLREKETLTEYDIKAAELRYQIALKEITLEEAQQNKTGMKLTRNEQGNWSYQYVADEEDVANKRQDLLDAYNDLYQLASDAYEANLQALQDLQQKYIDSAREIYENENLTEEERQQQLLELREWYLEQYRLLSEENQLYRNDLATAGSALLLEVYKQDEEAYQSMTENERELLDALVNANIDSYMDLEEKIKDNYQNIDDKAREVMSEIRADWTSGAQTIADLWNKDSGWSVKTQVVAAYDAIQLANQKYKEAVDWCAAAVERNFGPEGIVGAIQNAEYETDLLRDKTVEMVNTAVPYLQELKSYVNQIESAWEGVQDAIRQAISLIEEYLRKIGEASAASAEQVISSAEATATDLGGGSGSGSGGSGTITQQSWSAKNNITKQVTYNIANSLSGAYDWVHAQGGQVLSYNTAQCYVWWQAQTTTGYDEKGYKLNIENMSSSDLQSYANSINKRGGNVSIARYASGGYTGDWNDTTGGLAVLHQKELVLNENDTGNFLSAINTIRDLNSGLNHSIQDAVLNAVARTALSVGGLNTNALGSLTNNNSNTDNVFNITAEFPNANNVDEIREAILSLPNIASQYINSNLK